MPVRRVVERTWVAGGGRWWWGEGREGEGGLQGPFKLISEFHSPDYRAKRERK